MNIDLRLGDCIEVLKTLPDNSVDSVITDPPYGLSFMNKAWDYDVPTQEIWEQCLRVLKPGGHLISFAGSRTYHRMAVRIEDAGFEIRDQIMWVYGSGFPKSHNIGKAVDKIEGNDREVVDKIFPDGSKPRKTAGVFQGQFTNEKHFTKGNSEWEGWGTALKPAHEPMVLARKPLSEKSIAENVLKHGTGGINIDGSRIEMKDKENINFDRPRVRESVNPNWILKQAHDYTDPQYKEYNESGRFPANIIFDEEAGQLLDEQSGVSKSGKNKLEKGTGGIWNKGTNLPIGPEYGDKGGASRFFYCPKAAKKDRNEGLDEFEKKKSGIGSTYAGNQKTSNISGNPDRQTDPKANHHPTVKPTDLMRYLINLITPPNGTILDPFMGSGSTGKAAVRCGVNFIGIEKEQEYMNIAKARIEHEKSKPVQGKLL